MLNNYIKYKRFVKELNGDEAIQQFFDELITDGWNIIHYEERIKTVTTMELIVVCGKYNQNKMIL